METPAKIESLWQVLETEVIGLHAYWINYRQLFGKSKERYDLLLECAWAFFYIVDDTLLRDVQLRLGKLGDPAGISPRENASLQRLVDECSASGIQPLSEVLSEKLKAFQIRCTKIKYRRNKELAHSDLRALLEKGGHLNGKAFPGVSRDEIEQALEALRDFMNTAHQHFHNTTTAYERFVSSYDGNSLVCVLKQGLRYQQLRKDGVVAPDDLKNSGWFNS